MSYPLLDFDFFFHKMYFFFGSTNAYIGGFPNLVSSVVLYTKYWNESNNMAL